MHNLFGAIPSTQRARYDHSFLPADRLRQIALDLHEITQPLGAAWAVRAFSTLVPLKAEESREPVASPKETQALMRLSTEDILHALGRASAQIERTRTGDDTQNLKHALQAVRKELGL